MDVLAVHNDFSKGHWGEDTIRPDGWFGGENFIPLSGGRVVKIREGTVLLSNAGMANSANVSIFPSSNGLIASTGTSCWALSASGGISALTAFASSTTANVTDWCYYRQGVLVTILSDKTYYVTGSANTPLAGSPGGLGVAYLGDRIYVCGLNGNFNRVQWSDAASETSWGAGNILDLGVTTSDTLITLERQRDSLITVLYGGGSISEWLRISGTPATAGVGGTQTVSTITARGPAVAGSGSYTIAGNGNRIWFTPTASRGYGGYGWLDADVPKIEYEPRPTNSTLPFGTIVQLGYRIATSPVLDATFLFSFYPPGSPVNQRNLLQWEGIWSSHVFGLTGVSSGSAYNTVADAFAFYMAHGGSASTKPQFYSWIPVSSLYTAPVATDGSGADVIGTLELPAHYDPGNHDLQVQAVVVDYRHYSSSTTISCTVDALGVYNTTGPVSSSTFTTPSLGSPSTVGQRGQYVFPVSPVASGPGFRVRLTACQAVAIERVTVLGAANPSRV